MLQFDVGDNTTASDASDDFVPVAIPVGSTVTITNVAGSNLNVFAQGIDGGITNTLTPTQNVQVTGALGQDQVYLQSLGLTTVTLLGGYY